MVKEYRTPEQFESIVDSFTNGNWTQAAAECVEHGFYANDLLNALEAIDYIEELTPEWGRIIDGIARIAEMATEMRYKQEDQ